jgi:hypothetical protein
MQCKLYPIDRQELSIWNDLWEDIYWAGGDFPDGPLDDVPELSLIDFVVLETETRGETR